MAGVKGRSGGRRPGAGRKTKVAEDELTARLNPYEQKTFDALAAAIDRGEAWAVKLWFAYRYGRPKQQTEVTTISPQDEYEAGLAERIKQMERMRAFFGHDADDVQPGPGVGDQSEG